MKMFLIRHGESTQNTKENYKIKLPDNKVPLTDKGIVEANEVGKFLYCYVKDNNIDLTNATMWVSPYERTRQTADAINNYLNIKDVKEDITLIEQMYGLFSDMEIADIKKKYPNEFEFYDNYYQNDSKFYAKLPQGESPYDVALRTRQFLEIIFRLDNDPVFIVSHGTTIRTIIMNLFHYPPEWFDKEPNMENCSVNLINEENNCYTKKYIYGGPINKH